MGSYGVKGHKSTLPWYYLLGKVIPDSEQGMMGLQSIAVYSYFILGFTLFFIKNIRVAGLPKDTFWW